MANTHPKYGYYIYKDVFGKAGDFITAPEISQLFGEMVGAFLLHVSQTHLAHAGSRGIRLVELGPGRGTLMSDILRTWAQFGSALQGIKQCVLVEASRELRRRQESLLKSRFPTLDFTHSPTVDEVPDSDMLTICYSNEFFDALPAHMFSREGSGWREVLVDGLDSGDNVHFRFVKSPGPTAASKFLRIDQRFGHVAVGESISVCPEADRITEMLAGRIKRSGGIFLTVDYGSLTAAGASLRAIQRHKILSGPLESVGEADLSADVDFGRLAEFFAPGEFHLFGPMAQMDFLRTCGIHHRLNSLLRSTEMDSDTRQTLQSGVHRLTDSGEMGSTYKVFAAVSK